MTEETIVPLPDWTTAVPFVGLLVLVALGALAARAVRERGGRPRLSSLVWLLPFLGSLAFLYDWLQDGLYEGDVLSVFGFALTATIGGGVTLLRTPVRAALTRLDGASRVRGELVRAAVALVATLACTALSYYALEVPWNPSVLEIEPVCALVETLLVLGTLVFLYLLFQRRGAGLAVGTGAFSLIGIAQFFIASFKGQGITPSDLLSLQTAAAVSDSYVYVIDQHALLGVSLGLVGVALASLVMPSVPTRRRWVGANVACNLAAAAGVLVALWAGVNVPSYADDLGLSIYYWSTLSDYRAQGFLPSFVTIYQDMPIDVPEGYDPEEASELEGEYAAAYDAGQGSSEARQAAVAQYDETTPSIVVVMNETFSDLSVLGDFGVGYAGPTAYNSVSDALLRGSLSVSVLGGGTCNSEFEFLTGASLAYIGNGKYPYMLYDLSGASSLAKQLSALGYDTTAIHPNLATNWNRQHVYQQLGFDQFLDIDSFESAETFHSGVTDAETYDKVLEVLRGSDEPQFVFDVTMQNHSGYLQDNIPEDQRTNYDFPGYDPSFSKQLNEYLSCIEASDRDLAEFVAELSELDRPVVLLFFGDHQPDISTVLNDVFFTGEDDITHNTRIYQTTYLVWANYDVAGNDQASQWEPSTIPYLAAQLLESVGAPLTEYQKAQLVVSEGMPSINLIGYQGADGIWYELDSASPWSESYRDLSLMQYLDFASKVE